MNAIGSAQILSEREKQERLLRLAGAYRGLSRRELAVELGRDVSNLFPANGNPKLDYLDKLAKVLDWPVGVVAEAILGAAAGRSPDRKEVSFDALDEAALEAHRCGAYARMLEHAEALSDVSVTPDQRATAALREAGAHDGMGRYTAGLDAVRRGVQAAPPDEDLRRLLQVNLANAHYTLWYLFEARSMARELLDSFGETPPISRKARASHAFAHYVLGNADRRLLGRQPDVARADADRVVATTHTLREAARLYGDLADEFDHAGWRGVAGTCRGALLEVEVIAGDVDVQEALVTVERVVEDKPAADDKVVGDRLESVGWWCIFGCNIALRALEGRDLQQRMAQFTGLGRDIAERLGNWAMRERLFSLEMTQRERLQELAGVQVEWTMNRDALKGLVGTMGRFPSFRETGWRILRSATVVESN